MQRATMWLNLYGPTNPTPNPWNFHKKILRIGGAGKWPFFFRRPFWIFFFKKKKKNCFNSMKRPKAFIWGIIYFCTTDGFFRILEKTSSELICTRLYISSRVHIIESQSGVPPLRSFFMQAYGSAPSPLVGEPKNTLCSTQGKFIFSWEARL